MNLIENIRQYKYDVVNLGMNADQKNFIRKNFGTWFVNSKKAPDYDGLMPCGNVLDDEDILYEIRFEDKFTEEEIQRLLADSNAIFDKFQKKSTRFAQRDCEYGDPPAVINKTQEARLEALYKKCATDQCPTYKQDRNKLIHLYNFVGITNIHLAIPPAFEGVELFGSPLNTNNAEYCSPFAIEKRFCSLGSFFDYEFHKDGVYLCNPPFIDKLIERMANRLNETLDRTDRKVIVVITIPIWDSASQRQFGIDDYGLEFKGFEILVESNHLKYRTMLNKFKFPYFDHYKRKLAPASNTHLIILSNCAGFNGMKYAAGFMADWLNFVRQNRSSKG